MVSVGLPLIACAAIVTAALAAVITGRAWPLAAGVSTLVVCAVVIVAPMWPRTVAAPDHAIRLVVANVWDANPRSTRCRRRSSIAPSTSLVAVEMPDEAFSDEMTADARTLGLGGSVQGARSGRGPDSRSRSSATEAFRAPGDAGRRRCARCAVRALRRARPESAAQRELRRATPLHRRPLAAIADEQLPVVVAGDFNMSDRVVSYREMDAALTDAMRADVAGSTTYVGGLWPLLMLRIDHVFVEPRGAPATRPPSRSPARTTAACRSRSVRAAETSASTRQRGRSRCPAACSMYEPRASNPGPPGVGLGLPSPACAGAGRASRRRGVRWGRDRRHDPGPSHPRDQPPADLLPAARRRTPRPAPPSGRRVVLRVEGRRGIHRRDRRRPRHARGRVVLPRAEPSIRCAP